MSEEYDWSCFISPEELEGELFYSLNPLILEEHALRYNADLVKELDSDYIKYSILKNPEFDLEDPTQNEWSLEYGAEFYFDGSTIIFMNTEKESKKYAEAIAEKIFPELENRSLEYLEKQSKT